MLALGGGHDEESGRLSTSDVDSADRRAWSRGEEYVRLWKQGVRPDYSPALTAPIAPVRSVDFMGTRGRSFPPL